MTAPSDSDAILALDADCVLYTPRNTSIDDVCAILASGKNAVTTAFLFHPRRIAPADRDRLMRACQAGGTTVHGSGLNPGNLSGVLPLALSGMSRTIDKITVQERADWSVYESTSITFDNMAFGQPVESISRTGTEFLEFNSGIFAEQVWFLADALNADIDEVAVSVDAVAAEADHQIFERRNHRGATMDLVRTACRPASHRDRNAVDGRWRIPKALAETQGRLDADHRRRPVDAHALLRPGQFNPRRKHGRTRPLGQRGHRNAGPQRRVRRLRRPLGFATTADLPLIRSHIGFGNR
ncbi:dihydrodipicolinate reductase [Mycobacterium shigaense]|uniref:Dihydrodipicolinate reductase n=1 Tax=Mycobacterium shigaense TaxID=722731 RepID=A0A1Z4ENE7_9MYCO|nr:dihydrodipicolinate reductase [Mycobacterium shigaense]